MDDRSVLMGLPGGPYGPTGSIGTIRKTHQDTPVIHNSNPEGIRTGGVLMGFEGFRATFGRRVLNN